MKRGPSKGQRRDSTASNSSSATAGDAAPGSPGAQPSAQTPAQTTTTTTSPAFPTLKYRKRALSSYSATAAYQNNNMHTSPAPFPPPGPVPTKTAAADDPPAGRQKDQSVSPLLKPPPPRPQQTASPLGAHDPRPPPAFPQPSSIPPPPQHEQERLPSINFLTSQSNNLPNTPSSSGMPPQWSPQYSSQPLTSSLLNSHNSLQLRHPFEPPSPQHNQVHHPPHPHQQQHPHGPLPGMMMAPPNSGQAIFHHDNGQVRSGYSSRSNSVPSYLPSDNLAEKMAMASHSIEFSARFPPPQPPQQAQSNGTRHDSDNSSRVDDSGSEFAQLESAMKSQQISQFPPYEPAPAPPQPQPDSATGWVNWQDRQIDSYYQTIHPTLPLLPSSKVKLRNFLAACPHRDLCEALLTGVNGFTLKMNNPGASLLVTKLKNDLLHAVSQVTEECGGLMIEELPFEAETVYIVCLVLLFLFTDETLWLSSALSMAYSMNLHVNRTLFGHPTKEAKDLAADHRRLFLVLVTLDSMNSAVKVTPSFISESLIQCQEDLDSECFGSRSGVEILKLCMVLRQVNQPVTLDSLFKELEIVKQVIEGSWDTIPILKALYHFVLANIFLRQCKSPTNSNERAHVCEQILENLKELKTLMGSPLISVCPFMSFFYGLICEGACSVLNGHTTTHEPTPSTTTTTNTPGNMRVAAIELLVQLRESQTPGCFLLSHPILLKRIDRILSTFRQESAHHSQQPPPSMMHYSIEQQRQGHGQGHGQTQGNGQEVSPLSPRPPTTTTTALEKLANVADQYKVKLFI